MSGLSFSGKTTLAKKLTEPLNAQLLSYDLDIWTHHKPTLPKDISKLEEWEIIEAKARQYIAKLLKQGKNVIYDDLSVEQRDRELLRKTAKKYNSSSLVIFMNTPASVAIARQKKNDKSKERGLTSENNMQLVMSQLQTPRHDESAVIVNPDDMLEEIVSRIKSSTPAY